MRLDQNLLNSNGGNMLADFRLMFISATVASIVGACLIPTSQRLFSKAVKHFQVHRSIPRLILHGFLRGGINQIKDFVTMPASANVTGLRLAKDVSTQVIAFNVIAGALWTVGVFAALYA